MNQTPLEDKVFEYGVGKNKLRVQIVIGALILVALLVSLYFLFYPEISGTFIGKLINGVISFIGGIISHIFSTMSLGSPGEISLLGIFYVTFFGGLFFFFIPVEILFFGALSNYNPLLVLLVTAIGATISYSLDYIIGKYFSGFFKKLISLKKFYKTKAIINRYGGWAVVFFNIIGVGSQQTTFVLGVFRYNKMRLIVLTVLGQAIKYLTIIALFYISQNI